MAEGALTREPPDLGSDSPGERVFSGKCDAKGRGHERFQPRSRDR